MSRHRLLERQLRRHRQAAGEAELSAELLDAISEAYRQNDEDRDLLERAIEVASEELLERNQELKDQIAERSRAAKELETSMSLLRSTLEATADGILVVDSSGCVASFNQRFLDLWHIPANVIRVGGTERALALALDQVVDSDGFMERLAEIYARVDEESYDLLYFRDGRIYERYSRPQRQGEKTIGRVWSFRDATERHRLEERLRQSKKMEAVGRIAGGIAHDFGDLLTVITSYCDLCRAQVDPQSALGRHLAEIASAANGAAQLTGRLLAFSRRQTLRLQAVDLHRQVRELQDAYGKLLGDSIVIRTDLGATPAWVRGDSAGLHQVLLNLLTNARDALPEGGPIHVATAGCRIEEGDEPLAPAGSIHPAGVPGELGPGRYVVVRVRDSGVGIPSRDRAQVFEPFFTTKAVGEGSGLGLSVAYGIVKQCGGAIWLQSEAEQGTEVTVVLPAASAPGSGAVPEPDEAAPAPPALLLVVEDEEPVRRILSQILEMEGYQVMVASGADEGKALFEGLQEVDLLVTDVVMPGQSGIELAADLRRRQPRLPVLYMSGNSSESQALAASDQMAAFLPKPFDAETLLDRVRALLAETGE